MNDPQILNTMFFNYGEDERCMFEAIVYFTNQGVATQLIGDGNEADIRFLDSLEDLYLFLPEFENVPWDKERYISYILLEGEDSIIHCARCAGESDQVKIVEGKRRKVGAPLENEMDVSIEEYKELFRAKLEVICNAAGC